MTLFYGYVLCGLVVALALIIRSGGVDSLLFGLARYMNDQAKIRDLPDKTKQRMMMVGATLGVMWIVFLWPYHLLTLKK